MNAAVSFEQTPSLTSGKAARNNLRSDCRNTLDSWKQCGKANRLTGDEKAVATPGKLKNFSLHRSKIFRHVPDNSAFTISTENTKKNSYSW